MMNPYSKAQFLKSAAHVRQLPDDSGYEVAFAGRSNAGKSSALNCLTGIRQLARTSKTPGRTQLLNVFTWDDGSRRLLDLPGYGYAKVALKMKQDWQINVSNYLHVRQSLKGLILLMDIRHPLKELDLSMVDCALARRLPVHILLTKADKLSRGAVKNTLFAVRTYYEDVSEDVTVQAFSSLKKEGIAELVQRLNSWLCIMY